jgi:GTP-binding protein
VLVELMRREGFELTVGQPRVVTREIDGKVNEPIERLTIDVPDDYVGVVTQLLALRKGRLEQMVNHGTGWVRMEYLVPARALVGFRTESHRDAGRGPPRRCCGRRRTAHALPPALVADRAGQAVPLFNAGAQHVGTRRAGLRA